MSRTVGTSGKRLLPGSPTNNIVDDIQFHDLDTYVGEDRSLGPPYDLLDLE